LGHSTVSAHKKKFKAQQGKCARKIFAAGSENNGTAGQAKNNVTAGVCRKIRYSRVSAHENKTRAQQGQRKMTQQGPLYDYHLPCCALFFFALTLLWSYFFFALTLLCPYFFLHSPCCGLFFSYCRVSVRHSGVSVQKNKCAKKYGHSRVSVKKNKDSRVSENKIRAQQGKRK